MKYLSKFSLVVFVLVAIILSSCKKNSVEPEVIVKPTDTTKVIVPPPIPPTTGSRIIYVSADTGNDASANPFSAATPYKTLQKASDITLPGDVVSVMNGTYEPPATTDPNHITLKITRSGSASGGYITYKRHPGASPVIFTSGKKWATIIVEANYIAIDGLEVKGANNNTPGGSFLTAALAAEGEYRSGGRDFTKLSQFNTAGISVGQKVEVHHVTIRNCDVHDFPGGGISVIKADYVTVEGNKSYNNNWFGMYGGSGIAILLPINSDNNTSTYKIQVLKNICFNNYPQVPYYESPGSGLSDGNGIILDINYGHSSSADYTGKTLVENNICYLNGGGGVHLYRAQNIDVINNTSYNNETVLNYANIDANRSRNVRFINNIAYAKNGGKAFDIYNNSVNVSADYNLNFNGTVKSDGLSTSTHNIVADPKFIDKAGANFNLLTTSPAINFGDPSTYPETSTTDVILNPRVKNGRRDIGAYEVN